MVIALGIFIIASVLEVRYLFRQKQKKEAVIHLCILAAALGISVYLMLTPKFYSFARMVTELFGIPTGAGS